MKTVQEKKKDLTHRGKHAIHNDRRSFKKKQRRRAKPEETKKTISMLYVFLYFDEERFCLEFQAGDHLEVFRNGKVFRRERERSFRLFFFFFLFFFLSLSLSFTFPSVTWQADEKNKQKKVITLKIELLKNSLESRMCGLLLDISQKWSPQTTEMSASKSFIDRFQSLSCLAPRSPSPVFESGRSSCWMLTLKRFEQIDSYL